MVADWGRTLKDPTCFCTSDLKILVILAGRLLTTLPSLICPEQSCAVKGRTIQYSLHMVSTIVEKDALVNLDLSKAFDRVDYSFQEAILFAAGFGLHFRSWIHLYTRPGVTVYGVRSEPFTLTRSIHQGCLLLPGSSELARYTAYADDVSVLLTSSVEVDEVSKEIGTMKSWQGPRLTAKSPSVCGWVRGKSMLFLVPSFGGTARIRYSASGSVPISS